MAANAHRAPDGGTAVPSVGVHDVTRRIIDRAPRWIRPGVELVVRTVDDTFSDRVPGLAAEIAFFTLLSLPPLLVTVLAGVGEIGDLVGRDWRVRLATTIKDGADLILTGEGMELLDEFLTGPSGLIEQSQGSLVGIGFVITLFSASRALRVVSTALTIAYDLRATRPPWKDRLWGVVLTLGALVVSMVVGPVLVAGPDAGATLSDLLGGVPGLTDVWRAAYWPATGVTLTLLIAVLYHFAAPWQTPFRRDLPGAVLAMLLWLIGTAGLRVYVTQAIGDSYGFIATPLILLLWMYVSAIVLLLGAELNAEIEKMWPTHHVTDPEADPNLDPDTEADPQGPTPVAW